MLPYTVINFPGETLTLPEWRRRVCKSAIKLKYGDTRAAAKAMGCCDQLIHGVISGRLVSRPMEAKLSALVGIPQEILFPRRAA